MSSDWMRTFPLREATLAFFREWLIEPAAALGSHPYMTQTQIQEAVDLAEEVRQHLIKFHRLSRDFEAQLPSIRERLCELYPSSPPSDAATLQLLPVFRYLTQWLIYRGIRDCDDHAREAIDRFCRGVLGHENDSTVLVSLIADVLRIPNLHWWSPFTFEKFTNLLGTLRGSLEADIARILGEMKREAKYIESYYITMSDCMIFASGAFDRNNPEHEATANRVAGYIWSSTHNGWVDVTVADIPFFEDAATCNICLSHEADETLYRLSCNCTATYHEECLASWFSSENGRGHTLPYTCIYCQQPIKTFDDWKRQWRGHSTAWRACFKAHTTAANATAPSSSKQVQESSLPDDSIDNALACFAALSLR